MNSTLFVVTWAAVAALAAGLVGAGSVRDVRAWLLERQTKRVLALLAVLVMDSDSEAQAVQAQIGRLPKRALFAVLQELSADFDGQARVRLERVVRARGLDRHIDVMSRSQRWRHRIQAANLQHLASGNVELWQRLVSDRHPLVRARSIASLNHEQRHQAQVTLIESLTDPHPAVRLAAKGALLRLGDGLVPIVLALLERPPEAEALTPDQPASPLDLLLAALELACHSGDSRFGAALMALTMSDRPVIREAAATALARSGADPLDDLRQCLEQLLEDPEAGVRAAAVHALSGLNSTLSVAVIGRCLSDSAWTVRRASGLALEQLGPAGALLLRHHLEDEDPFARDMARKVLDAMATQLAQPQLPLSGARS